METKAVMNEGWIALAKKKPLYADRPVLLFSPRLHKESFGGNQIMISNSIYAQFTAAKNGWTHWADVPWPYPKTTRQPTKRR